MEDKSVEILLFEALRDRICDAVGEIETVEVDNSQPDHEPEENPRLYPYITLRISVRWEPEEARNSYHQNLLQNQQKGSVEIVVNYIYASKKDATTSWLEEKTICHKVYRALNGYCEEYFTPLIRTNTEMDINHNAVSTLPIVFTSEITEYGITNDDLTEISAGVVSSDVQVDFDIDNDTIRTGDGLY